MLTLSRDEVRMKKALRTANLTGRLASTWLRSGKMLASLIGSRQPDAESSASPHNTLDGYVATMDFCNPPADG